MKRVISLTLLVCMLLGIASLSSCGGGGEATKPQNVFRETRIELPEEFSGDNVNFNSYAVTGDVLNALVYTYDLETYMPSYFVAKFSLTDGSLIEKLDIPFVEQNKNGGANLTSFTATDDGSLYFALEKYSYSEDMYNQSYEVLAYRNGEFETLPLNLIEEDLNMGFYINRIAATDDGSLVLASWNGIRILSPDGKVGKIEIPSPDNANVENLMEIDGKLYASIYEYTEDHYGSKLYELDTAAGKLGDTLEIAETSFYNVIFGEGYDYYYNDRSSLWGCSFDGGEKVEVINFINSDINGNDISTIIPLSADRFFLMLRDRSGVRQEMAAAFLDRVPDDEVVEKKMLRLAVNYASYALRTRVIEFNKSSDTYRITIDDYSRFNNEDNYNAGVEKLSSDIITGNVPDIFMLNSEMPYSTYAARGVFADLYELMDADPDFNRGDYLENIFEAFEYDGELVTLVPSVNIYTFAAKKELGENLVNWNLSDFVEFSKANPDMRMFDYDYSRSNFVQMFMTFCRDNFIDDTTGVCRFDSEEFRTLLEIAKSMPEQTIWETGETNDPSFWQEYDARFKENRVLLAQTYVHDLNYSYKNMLNYTFNAEPVFVGFPSGSGNGAVIEVYEEYAIGADSDFKEGAWQFIKILLEPENQMPYYNEQYGYWDYPANGIPLYIPAIEKMAEIAMTPPKTEDNAVIGGAVTMPAIRNDVAVAVDVAVAAAVLPEITVDEAVDVEITEEIEISDDAVTDEADAETEEIADEPAVEDDIIINDGTEDGFGVGGGVWNDPYSIPLTQAQVDAMLELIRGTTVVARQDSDMNDIINEELAPYFAGTQSLDDTVKHIQSRVSIYVNESR